MSGSVLPFRKSSGPRPRSRASGRTEAQLLPAATLQQAEALRRARQHIADCWTLRAESRRIQRGYEARQKKIEELMDGLGI